MNKIFLLRVSTLLLIFSLMFLTGCQQQIDPRVDPKDKFALQDSLENTAWRRDDDGYTRFDIVFISNREANDGQSNMKYTYNRNTRKGEIEVYGIFNISDDEIKLTFPSYKSYGHPVYFSKVTLDSGF